MLGILRGENEDGTRPPTQWLEDLPALVEDVRAASLEVELVTSVRPPRFRHEEGRAFFKTSRWTVERAVSGHSSVCGLHQCSGLAS